MIPTYAVSVPTRTTLNPTELQAWVGLLHAHASLVRQLDAELMSAHGMSVSGFEVLHRLASAPDGRMRMTDLAGSVLLSPSGLSRLVDRLESDLMLERVACPTDGRAINATISEFGRARLAEAEGTHFDGVRKRFLDHFSAVEVAQLATFWTRFAPHCD